MDRNRKYQISKPNVKVQIEKTPAVKIETKTATPQPVQLAKNDQKFKLNVDFDHKEPNVSHRDKNDDTPPPLPPPQPLKDTNEASHKNFDITFRVPNVHNDSEKNKENTPPPESSRTLMNDLPHASEKHTEKNVKAAHDDDEPLISVRTDHSQGIGLTLNNPKVQIKPLISVGGKAHDEHEKAPLVEAKHDEHAEQHKPFLSLEHNQHDGLDISLNNQKVSS